MLHVQQWAKWLKRQTPRGLRARKLDVTIGQGDRCKGLLSLRLRRRATPRSAVRAVAGLNCHLRPRGRCGSTRSAGTKQLGRVLGAKSRMSVERSPSEPCHYLRCHAVKVGRAVDVRRASPFRVDLYGSARGLHFNVEGGQLSCEV